MIVVFVHGWSVQHTDTYGELPRWLQGKEVAGGGIMVGHIYLGRYISFDDEVTVDDIARAFKQAVHDELEGQLKKGERFACVTHSTGGPVIRQWIHHYYGENLSKCPMSHLIMLAPANPGSALALTYYVDYDVISEGLSKPQMEGKMGFRIVARPTRQETPQLVFYDVLNFQSTFAKVSKLLCPNETLMVEIEMERLVDATVFRMTNDLTPSPIDDTPSGKLVL